MRLDRPDGFYAFYWHYAIGLGFAACIATPAPSLQTLLTQATYLAAWVLLLRGVTCTWNDNLDQEFDRRVTRTKNRPIARGAVSTANAHLFTLAQMVLGGALLLPLPEGCIEHAVGITAVLMIYPLGKRFTDFPQVILGVGFAMPVFMCCSILGVQLTSTSTSTDPAALTRMQALTQTLTFAPSAAQKLAEVYSIWNSSEKRLDTWDGDLQMWFLPAALALFAASLLWTIIFDTVYAHQDRKDDLKAGVRSTAVLLGGWTKPALSVLAGLQVLLLLAVGVICGFSRVYFVLACGGAAVVLGSMLRFVRLDQGASCAWWFGPGSKLVGGALVLGLWGEYAVRCMAA
ncbi:UbiA prenyltransferase family [Aspergillus californicus]